MFDRWFWDEPRWCCCIPWVGCARSPGPYWYDCSTKELGCCNKPWKCATNSLGLAFKTSIWTLPHYYPPWHHWTASCKVRCQNWFPAFVNADRRRVCWAWRKCLDQTFCDESKKTAKEYVRVYANMSQHKHLRENSWKLPQMSYLHALDSKDTNPVQSTMGVISLEFEQQWETTSDINEDDWRKNEEDMTHWWGRPPLTSREA